VKLGLQLYSVRDEAERVLPGVKEAGLRLGYHSHHFEFELIEDTTNQNKERD
jgi:hypothetical protein